MSKQVQKATGEQEQNKPKNRPVVAEQVENQVAVMESPKEPGVAYDSSIQGHAVRLNDTRFSTVQRQTIAAQIGRVGGNQYLQRVMAQMKKRGQKESDSSPVIQTQPDETRPSPQTENAEDLVSLSVDNQADGAEGAEGESAETPTVAPNTVTAQLLNEHPPEPEIPGRAERSGYLQTEVPINFFESKLAEQRSTPDLSVPHAKTPQAESAIPDLPTPPIDILENPVADHLDNLTGLSHDEFAAAHSAYQARLPQMKKQMQQSLLQMPLTVPYPTNG